MRRIKLSGIDFVDADWTNPANPPPDSARPFKVVSKTVAFDIIGRASTQPTAAEQDVGAMTINAWVGYEAGDRDPTDPAAGKVIRRGLTLFEAAGAIFTTRVRIIATDAEIGGVGRLNLTLADVGALPAVEIKLVSGARLL